MEICLQTGDQRETCILPVIYSYDQRPRGQSTDLWKFPTQCINTQKHTPYKSDTTTTHSPGLQLVGDTIT